MSKRRTTGANKGPKRRGRSKRAAAALAQLPRARKLPTPLTPAQEARHTMLRRAGVDRVAIEEYLRARGILHTRQGIGGVIRNRYINEDVIAAFCALTGTTRLEAWPDLLQPGETFDDDAVCIRVACARGIEIADLPFDKPEKSEDSSEETS